MWKIVKYFVEFSNFEENFVIITTIEISFNFLKNFIIFQIFSISDIYI